MIHPAAWFLRPSVTRVLTLMEEVIWDRGSTHNHGNKLMWPTTERLYVFRRADDQYRFLNSGELPFRSDVWRIPLNAKAATKIGHNVPFHVELAEGVIKAWSREGDVVCARAFQAAVGCVNAARGNVLWTRPAVGAVGVHGDARSVFGVESDGRVMAWRRADGQPAWSTEQLRYRDLSPPLAIGRSVAVGDASGLVHWLSREDGALLTRMATDGSPVVGAPVLAGGTVVVVTRKGGVFGFRPD